ncbi:MAG: DUF262 domain-containing protein [Candidatus Hydrogenedentota bacterium]
MAITEFDVTSVVEDDNRAETEDGETSNNVQYSISSYGADYPVDMLVDRLRSGSIEIPDFQRSFVWTPAEASRFIESLLLGLPVPGIFLYKEPDTQKLLVIDGQQRLRTLWFFYDEKMNGTLFKLRGVKEAFDGLTYKTLSESDRLKLDNSILHATIVQQDDPKNDASSIYLVFERLNTGGTTLSPQEIRRCVYHGEFASLLEDLNKAPEWRCVFGPINKRGKDQELILRFFALFYSLDTYRRPMKIFLNKFMEENKRLNRYSQEVLSTLFFGTVLSVSNGLGKKAFRPEKTLNAAVADSVLVAIARRLKHGPIDRSSFLTEYGSLMQNSDYLSCCQSATTDEENVKRRIVLATEYMGKVQ